MKPESPFVQAYQDLPPQLPLYFLDNALLPGGEVPLELSNPEQLAMFRYALRSNQLIGLLQPAKGMTGSEGHTIGCAGRIRQYRERKDGRLNVMMTGVCRFRIVSQAPHEDGFNVADVDWSEFAADYESETVDSSLVKHFHGCLRAYFDSHNMQVDWKVLQEGPVEKVINNLVLVVNLPTEAKQQLLEAVTVTQRLQLFSGLLEQNSSVILSPASNERIN